MSQSELTRMLEAETLAQDPAEERVTQRLKDYWNTLRGGQQFPSRANFRMEAVTGLEPHAFALDLAQDADDPVFRFVGKALTDDCGQDFTLKPLSAVPHHTLLAEVAKRYIEVVDKKTPVEFAEEHVGADGSTALFRGAMLPFSEDGQTLDFIVGAITYKKMPSETTLAPVHAESPVADTAKADEVAAVAASAVGHVSELPRLSQSLEECQALAREVVQADSKSRQTLYRALESAYAFYFMCEANPEAYAEILDTVSLCNSENLEASFMPRIQETKLNKGHQRKLKALRKSLGKKIADEAFSKWLTEVASGKKKASKIDPVAARLADCIGKEDKKKKLKLPRGGYLVRRGFQGVILAEAAPAKPKKTKAAIKPKKKAAAKPKKRKPAAKKAAPKKTSRKKR